MLCPKCGKDVGDIMRLCEDCEGAENEKRAKIEEALSISEKKPLDYQPAGFWLRFFACVIDTAALHLIYFIVFNLIFFGIFSRLGEKLISLFEAQLISLLDNGASLMLLSVFLAALFGIFLSWLIIFAIGLLYYPLFESSKYKATPGKLILGLFVSDMQGERLCFKQAFVRHLAKFISTLIFGFGYIMAGFTEHKQGLHDVISNCLVVKNKDVRTQHRFWGALGATALLIGWLYFSNNEVKLPSFGKTSQKTRKRSANYENFGGSADVSGSIQGEAFTPSDVHISKQGILVFREGEDFFADKKIAIFLFDKLEELEGRLYTVTNADTFGKPHVHISHKVKEKSLPDTEIIMGGYEMELLIKKRSLGTLSGSIKLKIAKKKSATLEGEFLAAIKR